MEGWIKLYRKVLDNPVICKDSDHIAVWMHLLLNATHKEHPTLFSGQKITLRPGQLITGRKAIADKYKISESKVQRILKTFESEQQIEQQTANKNRLVSILSWDEYQGSEQQNEHQVNTKRTPSEQQVNTNKNVKNIENVKNGEEEEYSAASESDESIQMIADVHREVFGTMFMSGVMSEYVIQLKKKGCSDQFIAEAMREAGESSPRPNLKFFKAIGERWFKDGIETRQQAAEQKNGGASGGGDQKGSARNAEANREAASRNEELFVGSPRAEPTVVDREFAESLKDFR